MESHEESGTTANESAPVLSTTFRADDADVVIRTAGTYDFRVHRFILSLVSPIFKDMFTVPQPPTDNPETLPRIDLDESAETWENILRTIYPMPNPIVDDIDDLESLLLTAIKYEMRAVIDTHKPCFENRAFLRAEPLRLYAIACACGLDEQAKYVAKNAELLTVVRRSWSGELRGLTLASHHRLITFLVERDNELYPILEKGWVSFCSYCDCLTGRKGLYGTTKEKLKTPYIQMEEVYFSALKDRSKYSKEGCSKLKCPVIGSKIKGFLEEMFAERERVCDKFMWDRQR